MWKIPQVYEHGRTRPQDSAALRPQPSTDGSILTEPRMEMKQQGSTKRGCHVCTTLTSTHWMGLTMAMTILWLWLSHLTKSSTNINAKYHGAHVLCCLFDFFFLLLKEKSLLAILFVQTHAEQGMEQEFRITVRVRQSNCLYLKLPSNRGLALS